MDAKLETPIYITLRKMNGLLKEYSHASVNQFAKVTNIYRSKL